MKKKSEKLNQKQWKKRAKELEEKLHADLNIDYRKKLSSGKISHISRVYNELRQYQQFNFIPIKRVARESKTAFKKRLSQTKRDNGQSHLPIGGLYIDAKEVSIHPKRILAEREFIVKGEVIVKKVWTTEIETKGIFDESFKEKRVTINPITFAKNPEKILRELQEKYKDKYLFINPIHSVPRGRGSYLTPEQFEKFIDKILKWTDAYKDITKNHKNEHWLTGFLFSSYGMEGPEDGEKKRKKKSNRKKREH